MQHLLILLCSKNARPVMGHELHTIIICSAVTSLRDVPGLGTIQIYTCFSLHCLIYLSCNASASAQLTCVKVSGLELTPFIPHSDQCCP
jgi:hypothetical protein